MLVEQAEVHQQMGAQFAGAEGIQGQLHGQGLFHRPVQPAHQGFILILFLLAEFFRKAIQGLQTMTIFLRQGLQQGDDFFLQQPRHQPLDPIRGELIQSRQR